GPWSPLGYRVVVVDEVIPLDEEIPVAEAAPQPGRLPRETCGPPAPPWALPGYRVVGVAAETGPRLTRPPPPGARAARRPPPPTRRSRGRWGAVGGGGAFLLVAAVALAAGARGARDRSLPAEDGQRGGTPCAACDVRAAGETFGTAVRFVRDPSEAARLPAREQKPPFLLPLSGGFHDPGLPVNNAQAPR